MINLLAITLAFVCLQDTKTVVRQEKTEYNAAVAKYREFARKIYANYLLDRPRRTNQSGWPKFDKPERFDRHAWPYQVSGVLGAEEGQAMFAAMEDAAAAAKAAAGRN